MTMRQDPEAIQYILHTAREADVKFIRLWFSDILGTLKGITITVEELEDALTRGVSFDGSSIQGFARVDESDMTALPDLSTFRIIPWRPRQNAVARLFCEALKPDGTPFEGDPRHILRKGVERANRLGFQFYVGPEMEYFYLRDSESFQPLDRGDYFDQTPTDIVNDLRRETILTLGEMGIPIQYAHHEVAPSQHELDPHYADALTMADGVMTIRTVVKEVALRQGVYATFMPKPMAGINGSGMHANMSLFQGGQNAFYDPQDPLRLSALGRSFVAGLLRHARELTLVTNQWVNSYKRLVPGYEAPVYISWASINRSDLIRIPAFKVGREDAVRVEYRAPDPACNPYLAFAALLAAGLAGIERGYELPPPVEENVYAMSEKERLARGIKTLPGSLAEAIQEAAQSQLLRDALGEQVLETLLENKRIEWDQYRSQVTDYEVRRYLPVL